MVGTKDDSSKKRSISNKKRRNNRTETQIKDDSMKRKKLYEESKNKQPNNRNILYQKEYHKNISDEVRARKNKTSIIHMLARRQKNKDELIVVYDHNDINNDKKLLRYYTTSYNFGSGDEKESTKARDQSRIFLHSMFGSTQTITHLRHLGNPHVDGYYKNYDEKKINETSCHHLLHAYQHNESKILVATSNIRTELIFIPNIFAMKFDITSILSTLEMKMVQDLRMACSSTELLLNFELNGTYTIKKACIEIGLTKSLFHSCVPHLRYATHCCKNCGSIHKFTNKEYKLYNKSTKVVEQYGTVKLVHSNVKTGTAAEAFLSIVLPLTKMLEYVLQSLPEELFEKKLGSIKTLYGTACTYISLNLFWGASTDDSLPKMYYTRKRVGAKDTYRSHKIGDNHDGLYLHKDKNNWGFGAVLIFGADIDGFDQRYVTLALRLPCPGWSLVLGDYRNLLHAVSKGKNKNGLRFSLVIANHKSTVKGINECGQAVFNEDGINPVS